MADETNPEIYNINYGTLIFRQVDRILSLVTKEFASEENKLFTLKLAVIFLRQSIPSELLDDTFHKEENNIDLSKKNNKNFGDQLSAVEELYYLCINQLAKKGYLYKKTSEGDYFEEA